jgi:prophage regulatory protein
MTGLRIKQVEEKLGIKRSTIYELMRKGLLPQPIKIGGSSIWIESEVDQAMIAQATKRTKGAA